MLLLGIDLGTSSIKVSVVNADTQKCIASTQFPETEVEIISAQTGWAEQSADQWWEHVKQAILKCHATKKYDQKDIAAIGIAYQMHGLVLVDKDQHVLRNSIIWCDSRAVEIGDEAFHDIGEEKCLSHLLNSPGNFTASKLAWVKKNEPDIYGKINKIMLPGDFIAMKFTGNCTTTSSALSEGIFWNFETNNISDDVLNYFGFDHDIFPAIQPLFSSHGNLKQTVADRLSLTAGIPVSYKAGDQLNNALSLNVLKPGEIAATAGTSGVIYGVSDHLNYDQQSRINSFAHVNHDALEKRIGILLCINGAGIFNRWIKNLVGTNVSYQGLNDAAAKIDVGSNGLMSLPFGNGAERMLENKIIGAHFYDLDFNIHSTAHMVRAVQEGIAFAFRYGLDIMRENGIDPVVIRAGKSNLFLSDVFTESFVNATNVEVEFYEGDGSFGAAIGAGIGSGIYKDAATALSNRKPVGRVIPNNKIMYDNLYEKWKDLLNEKLKNVRRNHELLLA
ncbi:MAG TPA: FGGY family carbohydrate kinase [Chitinophagaceae bacterium]